jgi:hypothetical protein
MPEVCRFFGIVIACTSMNIIRRISTRFMATGNRNSELIQSLYLKETSHCRATSLVIEWAALHQRELLSKSAQKQSAG